MQVHYQPSLIAITDAMRHGVRRTIEAMECVFVAGRPGTICVQLRDAELGMREKFALGQALRAKAKAHGQWFAVNDRLDLAVLLAVPAVHLGERSLGTEDARQYLSAHSLFPAVSRACHEPSKLLSLDADAAIVSPAVQARKGRSALGIAGLVAAQSAANSRSKEAGACRVFALGGISSDNLDVIRQAGVSGIAVQGAAYDSPSEVRALVANWGLAR